VVYSSFVAHHTTLRSRDDVAGCFRSTFQPIIELRKVQTSLSKRIHCLRPLGLQGSLSPYILTYLLTFNCRMHEQQFGILLLSMIYWSIDTIANVASRYLRREVVVRWFQWRPMSLGSFGRWRQCVCHWSRQVSVWRVLSVPEHVLCLTQPLVATLWWCLDVYRLRRCRPTPETNRHCRRTTDALLNSHSSLWNSLIVWLAIT